MKTKITPLDAIQPELIPDERLLQPKQDYEPLASVWYGTDEELLDKMLDFYPRCRPQLVLDATVNARNGH